MSWIGSARMRAGLVVVSTLLAAGALAVVTVHANASGAAVRPSARALSPRLSGLLKRSSLKHAPALAGATTHAPAMTSDGPTVVTCGETLTTSTTLSANLECESSDGLTLDASGITLNLDGHVIGGPVGSDNGVEVKSPKDTVENGYIVAFSIGVLAEAEDDTVTSIQASGEVVAPRSRAQQGGIILIGNGDKATKDTVIQAGTGIGIGGQGNSAEDDHVLENGNGLVSAGEHSKIIDNVADGNEETGIAANELSRFATVTGNVANFNGQFGIFARFTSMDGGSNTATGNGKTAQCSGVVVCAP